MIDLPIILLAFIRNYAFLCSFGLLRQFLKQPAMLALCFGLSCAAANLNWAVKPVLPDWRTLDVIGFSAIFLGELGVGLLVAMPFVLLLESASAAGRLIDYARGAMIAEQQLPGLEQRTSPLESLSMIMLMVVVFSAGVHRPVLSVLQQSYTHPATRLGLGLGVMNAFGAPALIFSIAHTALSALRAVCAFAAPAILGMFLLELLVMLVSRMLPRLALSSELAPAKLLLGLLLFCQLFEGSELPLADEFRSLIAQGPGIAGTP